MVPCGNVAVGWAGGVVCELSACFFAASAVCTVYSVSAFMSPHLKQIGVFLFPDEFGESLKSLL